MRATPPILDATTASLVDRLVDDAMDAYLDWRVECIALADAHDRWAAVPGGSAALAQAYADALAREEETAGLYAEVCRELVTLVPVR